MLRWERLGVRHIEREAKAPGCRVCKKCIGVRDRAARDIDQQTPVAHEGQECVIDEVSRRLVEWHPDHHDVGQGQQLGQGFERVDQSTLVRASGARYTHDGGLERNEPGLDCLVHSAVSDEKNCAVGQALVTRRRPPALIGSAHKTRDAALRREDQRERELGGRRLVHGCGVRKHMSDRQHLFDPVVSDRLVLHEPGLHVFELGELVRRIHVRRHNDVDCVNRRRSRHVPFDDLDAVGRLAERLAQSGFGHANEQSRRVHDSSLPASFRSSVCNKTGNFVTSTQQFRARSVTGAAQSEPRQARESSRGCIYFGGSMDTGDTAWILASSALVLLMTPGLAFFYGGMVRAKSVLNMMMMSFLVMAIVPVLWVLYGYSMTFDDDIKGGLLGGFGKVGLKGVTQDSLAGTLPEYVFIAFQLMFAIITVALISGAIADRAKFLGWAAFVVVWVSIVYFPVAHWVFAFDGDDTKGGWIANNLGALDFAGGTAVHINAGAAGLALALVLGKRVGWKRDPMRPHNLPLVLLGAGLLWFGWFGFNAGSALAANNTAAVAFMNTIVATAAASLGWLVTEKIRDKKGTSLGAASGAVAGLVAITPACAAISPLGSIFLGLFAGAVCALAVGLKYRFGYDDSLDVVGVHLVGGLVGTIGIGFIATSAAPAGVDGLLYGGGADQLWRQVVGAVAVGAFSFVVTLVIGAVLARTIGFRVDTEHELSGIDQVVHAESGYDFGSLGGAGGFRPVPAHQSAATEEVSA